MSYKDVIRKAIQTEGEQLAYDAGFENGRKFERTQPNTTDDDFQEPEFDPSFDLEDLEMPLSTPGDVDPKWNPENLRLPKDFGLKRVPVEVAPKTGMEAEYARGFSEGYQKGVREAGVAPLGRQVQSPSSEERGLLEAFERIAELERAVIRLQAITMGLSDQAANMDALQRAHSTALGSAG